jgi:acetolactate synthase I/II/III large subunit
MFWQKHYSEVNLERAPDFIKLAGAYDIPAILCDDPKDTISVIEKAMATRGPVLIDFRVAKETNVFPMIPSGQTINEMMTKKPEPVQVVVPEPKDTRMPERDEVVDVAR